jgi:hypothetical protein
MPPIPAALQQQSVQAAKSALQQVPLDTKEKAYVSLLLYFLVLSVLCPPRPFWIQSETGGFKTQLPCINSGECPLMIPLQKVCVFASQEHTDLTVIGGSAAYVTSHSVPFC